MMIQPFLRSVMDEGEYSLIYFDGAVQPCGRQARQGPATIGSSRTLAGAK